MNYNLDNLYKLYDYILPERNNTKYGVCQVTGLVIDSTKDCHNHHIIPREFGGSDMWSNRILVKSTVHLLIHAKQPDIIRKYLKMLNLNDKQLKAVNYYRKIAHNYEIVPDDLFKNNCNKKVAFTSNKDAA